MSRNAPVPTTSGGAVTNYANNFVDAGMAAGGLQTAYLQFSGKTGGFTYGKKKEEIPLGTQVAVLMTEYKRGYICWKNEKNVDEVMVPVVEGRPPLERDLPDHGPYEEYDDGQKDGWSEQASIMIKTLGASSQQFVFNTSSKSGLAALGALSIQYGQECATKIDEEGNPLVPIVELDQDSYQHKSKIVGTIFTPTFKIVDWLPNSEVALGNPSADGDDPKDYDDDEEETEEEETEEEETTAETEEEEKPKTPARRTRSRSGQNFG